MITKLTLRAFVVAALFFGGIALAINGHFAIGLAIHGVLVGTLLAGTLNPNSRLFGPIETGCGNGVWLTLDDGPDPCDTPAILDLLDQHGAKATFFVIGKKAEQHPELIREIVRRGHQLGNHTWSHPQASFWCHGPIRTYREIARCQNTIKAITGAAPTVFRAPVGHSNLFVHPVLEKLGLRLAGWSSRGFDGVSASLPEVTRRIRATATDGAIILAHEATPIAREVVAVILALASEKGWVFVIPDASQRSGNC
jgi:peptidoglycan/xylan/chitin deacetylase (PgdA/CDA1 family)